MWNKYPDREAAGKILATGLGHYARHPDVLILALPRGGVVVGYQVATTLAVPLDVFVVRKLGVPGDEELAMGAIASGKVRVLNDLVIRELNITSDMIERVASSETRELLRREGLYRGKRPFPQVAGKTVILVDDGLATGSTMRAAVAALRRLGPERLVVGVPVGAPDTCEELARTVDELVCPLRPEPFYAIGCWYERFEQTSDQEVRRLLDAALKGQRRPSADPQESQFDAG